MPQNEPQNFATYNRQGSQPQTGYMQVPPEQQQNQYTYRTNQHGGHPPPQLDFSQNVGNQYPYNSSYPPQTGTGFRAQNHRENSGRPNMAPFGYGAPQPKVCWFCQKVGHIRRDCYRYQAMQRGNPRQQFPKNGNRPN